MSWRPRSRPRPTEREPARVGGTLPRVLAELGIDVAAVRRLDEALAAALGPALAAHFELVDVRGRTLELRAESAAWSQELAARRSLVLARLREALGEAAPTELRLRIR